MVFPHKLIILLESAYSILHEDNAIIRQGAMMPFAEIAIMKHVHNVI